MGIVSEREDADQSLPRVTRQAGRGARHAMARYRWWVMYSCTLLGSGVRGPDPRRSRYLLSQAGRRHAHRIARGVTPPRRSRMARNRPSADAPSNRVVWAARVPGSNRSLIGPTGDAPAAGNIRAGAGVRHQSPVGNSSLSAEKGKRRHMAQRQSGPKLNGGAGVLTRGSQASIL